MKKIEELELQQLINIQENLKNLIFSLGEINYEKILIEERENKIKNDLNTLKEEEKTLKDYLIQKYGDNISIDLKTGEY